MERRVVCRVRAEAIVSRAWRMLSAKGEEGGMFGVEVLWY